MFQKLKQLMILLYHSFSFPIYYPETAKSLLEVALFYFSYFASEIINTYLDQETEISHYSNLKFLLTYMEVSFEMRKIPRCEDWD